MNACSIIDPSRRSAGYDGAPISLSAEITIASGEGGELPSDALRNPEGDPMELHELKWHVYSATKKVVGGALEVDFSYRDRKLTNNYVPLWGMGKADAQAGEDMEKLILPIAKSVAAGVWRFDKPIYIDPGETLIPKFRNKGLVSDPVKVVLTYSGRVVKRSAPARRWLPYIASYTSPVQSLAAAAQFFSTEKDLVNASGSPLFVQRFLGRVLTLGTKIEGYGEGETADLNILTEAGAEEFVDVGSGLVTLKMRDSRGYATLRDYAPFRSVFSAVTRSWECPHLLPKDAYYLLDLKTAALTDPPDGTEVPYDIAVQAAVSMLGWQEVRS